MTPAQQRELRPTSWKTNEYNTNVLINGTTRAGGELTQEHINNVLENLNKVVKIISDITPCNGICNLFFNDLCYQDSAEELGKKLEGIITDYFKDNPIKHLNLIAHSKGGLIVEKAMKNLLGEQICSRINVIFIESVSNLNFKNEGFRGWWDPAGKPNLFFPLKNNWGVWSIIGRVTHLSTGTRTEHIKSATHSLKDCLDVQKVKSAIRHVQMQDDNSYDAQNIKQEFPAVQGTLFSS